MRSAELKYIVALCCALGHDDLDMIGRPWIGLAHQGQAELRDYWLSALCFLRVVAMVCNRLGDLEWGCVNWLELNCW